MRSSTGLYVSRLDHVRAAAVFLVYCWHFVHVHVPFETVPDFFFLSLLEEGYAGVALFMTLSGYLFAKIMDGRSIDLAPFYRNRFLRLVPLLAVVLTYWSLRGFHDSRRIFPGAALVPDLAAGYLVGGRRAALLRDISRAPCHAAPPPDLAARGA